MPSVMPTKHARNALTQSFVGLYCWVKCAVAVVVAVAVDVTDRLAISELICV